jgi:hypothetical protein
MMHCAAFNEEDKEIFCKKLQITRTPAFRGIKGTVDGIVVCGAGFDRWTPNACETHLWIRSPGDLTRKFITEVFKYLFVTCDLGLVIGVTPCNNIAALRFNKKLGWKHLAKIRDGYAPGTDMAIQVIRREECRWIHQDEKCQKAATHLQPRITLN